MNGASRAGGLRLIRMLLVGLCVGVIALSFATVLLWQSNTARVQQINDERARNVQRSCEDVNARHDDTIRALDRLLSRAGQRASREQIRRSRASTVLLIDALAPKRDCRALVAQQVDTK